MWIWYNLLSVGLCNQWSSGINAHLNQRQDSQQEGFCKCKTLKNRKSIPACSILKDCLRSPEGVVHVHTCKCNEGVHSPNTHTEHANTLSTHLRIPLTCHWLISILWAPLPRSTRAPANQSFFSLALPSSPFLCYGESQYQSIKAPWTLKV